MKIISQNFLAIMLMFFMSVGMLWAQDEEGRLDLPGDNLNLYAVMELFRSSPTLEEFERKLNDPELMINNLDLNRDEFVDYISVHDYPNEDGVHAVVLRVGLSKTENQDVAVFFIEKMDDGTVVVQLVGDELLYGPNYIIEPNDGQTPNPGYNASDGTSQADTKVVYQEVAQWPIVVHIWDPVYVPWRSAWYFGYYPPYWNPWRPHYWHYYYGYHYHWHKHYHRYYRPWKHHRYRGYSRVYVSGIRQSSVVAGNNVTFGRYRTTYQRPESRIEGEALYRQRAKERRPAQVQRNDEGRRRQTQMPREDKSRYQGRDGRQNNQSIRESNRRSNEQQQTGSENVRRKPNQTQKDRANQSNRGRESMGSDRKQTQQSGNRNKGKERGGQTSRVQNSSSKKSTGSTGRQSTQQGQRSKSNSNSNSNKNQNNTSRRR